MTEKSKRRTVAEADIEISELKATIKAMKNSEKSNELNNLKKIINDRDLTIETLKGMAIPTPAEERMRSIAKVASKYKEGLYVANATPMFNSDSGQMFTVGKPLKVTEDQLKESWFMLQLASGLIKEYVV